MKYLLLNREFTGSRLNIKWHFINWHFVNYRINYIGPIDETLFDVKNEIFVAQ